jgi:hypothetical protein
MRLQRPLHRRRPDPAPFLARLRWHDTSGASGLDEWFGQQVTGLGVLPIIWLIAAVTLITHWARVPVPGCSPRADEVRESECSPPIPCGLAGDAVARTP